MIKQIHLVLFILTIFFFVPKSYAQFPYVESFRSNTAPGITFGGAPSAFLTAAGSSAAGGTPIDPLGDGYLRLTSNVKNQKGFVYSNSVFPSYNGLRVEFEYYIYGGTGADGISFFLFDATANPFVIGGFGGSLGYAQITTTDPISPGVSKGYLAIGLDEFGNFSNPIEGRQGGIPGLRPGSITLRGKGDGAATNPDNYKFLTTVKSLDYGIDLVGNGDMRVSDPTNSGYRRVLMELEPNPAGGYFITVKMIRGGATLTPITVIDRYAYSEAAPTNLRYGFASSTGDLTDFHEVRNVSISVFDDNVLVAPNANNDLKTVCTGNQATVDVAANDVTANVGGAINNTTIDLDPATPGFQKTFTVAGKGTFTANDNGTVTFVPLSAYLGNVSTGYTINDTYGKTSTAGTITVNYITPSIVANAGPDKVLNIGSLPLTSQLAATDPGAGNSGIWTQVSGPNTASFTDNTLYNTTVANLVGGVYLFRWTVTSAGGCLSTDEVQILVNRPPVAVNDEVSTNINTDIAFQILDNDTDPDGNATINKASVSIKNAPLHGTVVIDPVTGNAIYRPQNEYIGDDSFLYTIKDIYGAESNIAIVTIHVNIKPIGSNDFAETPVNIPVSIPVLNNDLGKADATVIKNTNPAHGTAVVNLDGSIQYTPAPDYAGNDTFTYILKSSSGVNSDPITVNVKVKPIGSTDNSETTTNSAIIIPIKGNDYSAAVTAASINVGPTNGTVLFNPNGTVTYTPKPDFSGKDTFTYFLTTIDGVKSDPITVNVIVKPIGSPDNTTTSPDTSIPILVKTNDISKTGTTVVINTIPANGGTVTINAVGNPVYTPKSGFSGKDTFTYILRTADGVDSDPITVTVTIKPIGSDDNPIPTITDTPITIDVKDNDLSKTGTTVVINTIPPHGTVTFNSTGVPVYTPKPGYSGKDSFTYILKTPDGINSDPITVNVIVKPAGSPDNVETPPATPILIKVKNNDDGATGTTVTLGPQPANGTVVLNLDGSTTYTPKTTFSGKDTYTYFLNTADGVKSDPITVTVTVRPIGSPDEKTTTTNTPTTPILVKDNDLSKSGTTVIINTLPLNGGTVALNLDGNPVYTPKSGYSGKDTFTYILRTADGAESAPITVTVTIKPVGSDDDPPATSTNTAITINVKDNDLSKTGTTVVVNTFPPNGSVAFNGAGLPVYTPKPRFSGKDSFTYILKTADGINSDPITVNVIVKPTGLPDPATTKANTPVSIPIKSHDDSQTNTAVVIKTPPAHGTATVDPLTGVVTYTPAPGYSGPDNFTYILKTPDGIESDPIPVTVTVKTPVVINAPDITIETPVGKDIKVNIPIPTGGKVIITDPPEHGTITFDPVTKQPIYKPDPGYNGPDDFTYIIEDPDGNTSTPGKVSINVLIPAKIGVAKELKDQNIVKNVDGSYNLTYTFTIKNYGDVDIDNVSLTDDLGKTFDGNTIRILSIDKTGTLVVNQNYNGTSVKELLATSSKLSAKSQTNSEGTVTLKINVNLDKKEGTFLNTAEAKGTWTSNGITSNVTPDQSTNGVKPDPKGDGDVTPSELTPVKLIKKDIFIPGGFSPNNDGINDFFVIENANDKQISLEVYNRWGNRVHKAIKYENNWAGKTTQGIHIGEDVPAGTYYYIITIDNKDKRVGYITINR